jgi:DNA-binding transcriptional MerR regulator
MSETPEMLTTAELARQLRVVSDRQLQHWASELLLPTLYARPGSGVRRLWSPEEVRQARVFTTLVDAGVDIRAVGEALRTVAIGPNLFVVKLVSELGDLTVTGELP